MAMVAAAAAFPCVPALAVPTSPLDGEPAAQISGNPPLRPAFSPAVSDYVVACRPGLPTRLRVSAPPGTRVAVDGARPRGGRFAASVDVAASQRFSLEVVTGRDRRLHHVRCLPQDFPEWQSELSGRPQAQWYVVTPSFELGGGAGSRYVAILDSHGTPVWWRRATARPGDARLLSSGNIAWASVFGLGYGVSNLGAYEERGLDGSLVRAVSTAGSPTDFHDYEETPGGGRLVLTYRTRGGVDLSPWGGPRRATVVDAEIQELDSAGNLVWVWNSSGHITLQEAQRWLPEVVANPVQLADGRKLYDIAHVNSVAADGDGLIVSMRHTDSLYRIDKATGEIDWKLGGTATADRLAFAGGDPEAPRGFGGQHDARVLGDGTLTVFDNGTNLTRPPRALRYRIDAAARSATLLESVSDPAAGRSPCCGNARRLGGGNWVVAWGGNPLVSEVTPSGRALMRLRFGGGIFTYRVAPIEFGRLAPAALRDGMDTMHPR